MLSLRYATSGGVGLAYFDYNRDVAGRILRIQREATAGYAIYYAYDNIDRLEAEVWRKSSDNSQVYGFWYSYDAANNRLQMRRETTAGVTWDSTYYQYAADNSLVRRQVATPPSTVVDTYYGYDANGALTQVMEGANATYFGYGANQLVTRILPPSEAATYFSYDGRLNRYYIDKAGTQTYYLWDGLNQLEERDGSGTLLARYTQGNYRQYGIGSVVEIERHVGAATYYQYGLGDHRGTFYKLTDQNQDVQIDYTLDAFGRQIAAPGGSNPTVPNDLIYQSNWLTLQIGGRWYGVSKYRLYDMELGVFLSRDFLRYLNKYRAWSNNPVGQVDKDGLAEAEETKIPEELKPGTGGKSEPKTGTGKFDGGDTTFNLKTYKLRSVLSVGETIPGELPVGGKELSLKASDLVKMIEQEAMRAGELKAPSLSLVSGATAEIDATLTAENDTACFYWYQRISITEIANGKHTDPTQEPLHDDGGKVYRFQTRAGKKLTMVDSPSDSVEKPIPEKIDVKAPQDLALVPSPTQQEFNKLAGLYLKVKGNADTSITYKFESNLMYKKQDQAPEQAKKLGAWKWGFVIKVFKTKDSNYDLTITPDEPKWEKSQ